MNYERARINQKRPQFPCARKTLGKSQKKSEGKIGGERRGRCGSEPFRDGQKVLGESGKKRERGERVP